VTVLRRWVLQRSHSIDAMVKATKVSVWSNHYHIDVDGRRVTTWNGSAWRSRGSFDLDGRTYQVRGNAWDTQFTMTDESGAVVAVAAKLGRREWTVTAGGQEYRFRRASAWRRDERLVVGGVDVGAIRRPSMWRSDIEADLPGLPVPVQIFTVGIVLTRWDRQAAAGAGAATTIT
jgi:hypothetical protein